MSYLRWFRVLVFFLPSLALLPSLSAAQVVGLWNGFLNQQNIIECANGTDKEQLVRGTVRSGAGNVLSDFSLTLPPGGSAHSLLNAAGALVDQLGTVVLTKASAQTASCWMVVYRANPLSGALDYAYALPFLPSHQSETAGVVNSINGGAAPAQNWLSLVNHDPSRPFTAILELRDVSGRLISTTPLSIAAMQRQDLALGHTAGEIIASYRIIPTTNLARYSAALTRYAPATFGDEYRFAVSVPSALPECRTTQLFLSTLEGAESWVELSNTSGASIGVELEAYRADGTRVSEESLVLSPFAQLHLSGRALIGAEQLGRVQYRCSDPSAKGVIGNALVYALDQVGAPRLSYLFTGSAPLRMKAVLPFNTFLGAENWAKLANVAGGSILPVVTVRTESGAKVPEAQYPVLPPAVEFDLPLHVFTGVDQIGSLQLSQNSALHASLIRVIRGGGGGGDAVLSFPAQLVPPSVEEATGPAQFSGVLQQWQRIALTFIGPALDEQSQPNPFLDHRFDVTFSNGSRSLTVPGFFAADGNAAESGATSGNKWRVYFVPDQPGTWTYTVSFKQGANAAVQSGGQPGALDGQGGRFTVAPCSGSPRCRGMLAYEGERYYRYRGNGARFLKGGANSPENFLAYDGFDQTPASHSYHPHAQDWRAGDPTWRGGIGKEIIGALNYLASTGMNAVYMLSMNVNGDGDDVWPWTAKGERQRFDVSKLDQWEVVFNHMDELGLMLHLVTQETENDSLLSGNNRLLYYRELVARFGHHLALQWNLGEENTNSASQRAQFAQAIRTLDPYDHPIVVHSFPSKSDKEAVYEPLLGSPLLDGASLQATNHNEILSWLQRSANAGREWVVTFDEEGPANQGAVPDAKDPLHTKTRKQVLWSTLLAGGAGVEHYFGYNNPHDDLDAEDWRSRHELWKLTGFALHFFHQHVPFWEMQPADHLVSDGWCLAKPGEAYVVYLPNGGTTTIDLSLGGLYRVRWFNPRTGALLDSSIQSLTGPALGTSLGAPPEEPDQDWAILLTTEAP